MKALKPMRYKKVASLSLLILVVAGFFLSCKKEEKPTILKVYVRSSYDILVPHAQVRIVGKISKGTPEYLKEKKTNEQGEALFNLDDLFQKMGKTDHAYFMLYARDTTLTYTNTEIRVTRYLKNVKTINL